MGTWQQIAQKLIIGILAGSGASAGSTQIPAVKFPWWGNALVGLGVGLWGLWRTHQFHKQEPPQKPLGI